MSFPIARFCLAAAAALALVGGAMHGVAFAKNEAALDASNLPAFFAGSAKGLWLADSATLALIGLTFALAALRPHTATRASLMLAALIPLGTAVTIYRYLGGFFAGHLLVAIAALGIAGAVGQTPRPTP